MLRHHILMIALASLLLLAAGVGTAAEIKWSAFTGGGNLYSYGDYWMQSAIGQPVNGLEISGHTLCSGFLCGSGATYPVFLPVVRK